MLKERSMELLYNFRPICDALLEKQPDRAKVLFRRQAAQVLHAMNADDMEIFCIFLNSMNRGIYYYILYAQEVSLHHCCYKNSRLIHHCGHLEEFYRSGETIIDGYQRCLSCNAPRNAYVEKAKQFIEENLDCNLTLADVCEHIYVSRSYLSYLFKSCIECTFTEYLTNRRIAKAKSLLLNSDLMIKDIALQCGFSTQSYFITVFKQHVRITPSKFRTHYKQEVSA